MTFGSSETGMGMDNSIPKIRDREGNGKKQFPKLRNKKGMKKTIPEIREWEGNEKIHSHNSGTGIRGYHSQEYPGRGMKKKHNMTIKEYVANLWREKEF